MNMRGIKGVIKAQLPCAHGSSIVNIAILVYQLKTLINKQVYDLLL